MPEFCLIKVSIFNYWIKKSVYVSLKGTTQSEWIDILGTVFACLTEMAHSCFHLPIPVLWDLLETSQKSSRETQTGYIAVSACFFLGASISVCMTQACAHFLLKCPFQKFFPWPRINYCCKKCRNPIFLNQPLLYYL